MSTESMPMPDYEHSDASTRFVAVTAGLLFLGMAVSLGVAALLYMERYRPMRISPEKQHERSFHYGPEERTSIERDWAEQDRLVHEHLYEYGWIDRRAGIVRIPVTRAMDLIVAESAAKAGKNHHENRP